MPPMFRASLVLSLLALSACGHQDGIVGRAETSDSGVPSAGAAPTYRSELESSEGWQTRTEVSGSSTEFGVDALGANGGELRFPGQADAVGPSQVSEIASNRRFGFGTFRTRLSFGACRSNEDVVNAAFGFFSDGTDANGNGITDDEEINLQVLCGAPNRLYLTVFTDYSATEFRKLSRMIDFGTGEVFETPVPSSDEFAKVDTVSAWRRPELFAPDAYVVLGFDWHAASLGFFIELDGAAVTLWALNDAARIPQRPVTFLYNLWHPEAHWYPSSAPAAAPASDVVMHVDWFEYYAE